MNLKTYEISHRVPFLMQTYKNLCKWMCHLQCKQSLSRLLNAMHAYCPFTLSVLILIFLLMIFGEQNYCCVNSNDIEGLRHHHPLLNTLYIMTVLHYVCRKVHFILLLLEQQSNNHSYVH